LDEAALPADEAELTSLKASILEQLELESFLADPTKLEAVTKQFDAFKRQYGPLYQIHHRDYYTQINNAKKKLDDAAVALKIEAILRLNKLGMNLSLSKEEFFKLQEKLETCAADPVVADTVSVCKDCGLALTDKPEVSVVDNFLGAVDRNVQVGMEKTQAILTEPILNMDKEKRLTKLVNSIRSRDVMSFVGALSDSIVDYLGKLLERANIVTIQMSISEFAQRFAFVEEGRIEDVVTAFREEILNKVKKAKKENPGKKIRISLGE
jgi:hypothetical protein